MTRMQEVDQTHSLPRGLRLGQVLEEHGEEDAALKVYKACAMYKSRYSGEVDLNVGDIVNVMEKCLSG